MDIGRLNRQQAEVELEILACNPYTLHPSFMSLRCFSDQVVATGNKCPPTYRALLAAWRLYESKPCDRIESQVWKARDICKHIKHNTVVHGYRQKDQ